jgi:hypothetical protein
MNRKLLIAWIIALIVLLILIALGIYLYLNSNQRNPNTQNIQTISSTSTSISSSSSTVSGEDCIYENANIKVAFTVPTGWTCQSNEGMFDPNKPETPTIIKSSKYTIRVGFLYAIICDPSIPQCDTQDLIDSQNVLVEKLSINDGTASGSEIVGSFKNISVSSGAGIKFLDKNNQEIEFTPAQITEIKPILDSARYLN